MFRYSIATHSNLQPHNTHIPVPKEGTIINTNHSCLTHKIKSETHNNNGKSSSINESLWDRLFDGEPPSERSASIAEDRRLFSRINTLFSASNLLTVSSNCRISRSAPKTDRSNRSILFSNSFLIASISASN